MDKQVFLMRLMDNLKREGGKQIRKPLAVDVCVLLDSQAPAVHIKCFLFHPSPYNTHTHTNKL